MPPKGIKFKEPPATNDARWMNRAIYALLMFMFRKQFPQESTEKQLKLRDLCAFIVKIYVRYWFTAPVAAMAPSNDLELLKCLTVKPVDRRKKFSAVLTVAKEKQVNHLWYLFRDLVLLALFDLRVSIHIKRKMLKNLRERESAVVESLRRISEPDNVHDRDLSDFVDRGSIKLFESLQIPQDFLTSDPAEWDGMPSFIAAKQIVGNLKVVNDIAERGVQLITEYNNILTNDEEQKQYLLQTVAEFRRKFGEGTKQKLSGLESKFV